MCDARLSPVAVRGTATHARARFALPMEAAAARAMCSTHRPAVHDEARGVGARHGPCHAGGSAFLRDRRAPSASAGGTSVGACRSGRDGARGGGYRLRRCAGRSVNLRLRRHILVDLPIVNRDWRWRVPFTRATVRQPAVRLGAALPVAVLDDLGGVAREEQHRDRFKMAIFSGKVQRRPPARQTAGISRSPADA